MAITNDLFKKPNQEVDYTQEQIQELLKCSKDPVYFIRKYVKVQHPKKGAIPFNLYDYQEKMINSFLDNRYVINLLARQSGKSVTIAAFLLWYTCFQFDKTVLVASNKNSNAMEIMQRVIYAYEELPDWLKPGVKYGTKHSLEFDNGSRIFSQATTENTGRGLSVSLLMLDELAFVPKRIQEEMWTSIAPTLSTGGSCIISSTPNGDHDLFASLWRGARSSTNPFLPIFVHWTEHPERDKDFKQTMIGQIGELRWRQEYECEFLSNDPLLISSVKLQQIKAVKPTHVDNGVSFWGTVNTKCTYYVGMDVATGVGADFSTIQVLEFPSMKQFAEFRTNKMNIQQLYAKLKWLLHYLSKPQNPNKPQDFAEVYWSFENNGVGAAIVTLYQNDEKFPEANLLSDPNRVGFVTTGKNKIMTCVDLKTHIEKTKGGITVFSDDLLHELKNYVSAGNSYAAKAGSTDDLVAAFLIVLRLLKRVAEFEPEVFSTMYNYEDYSSDPETYDMDDTFGDDPLPIII